MKFTLLTVPEQVAGNTDPAAEVVICCEADEQWSYARHKGNPRWLFYAYLNEFKDIT